MRRVTHEDGAYLPFFVLMVVVLIGFAAVVVDFGAIYWERRQLQNGADAAAVAIAQDCARGLPVPSLSVKATALATLNANDLSAGASAAVAPSCAADAGSVQVSTRTSDGGSTILPPLFGQVLGYSGMEVNASAAASWGAAGAVSGAAPLAVSACEWGAHAPPSTTEITIILHDPKDSDQNSSTCPELPSGANAPGGFGWLTPEADCTTSEDLGGADGKTGNLPCAKEDLPKPITVLHVPIYDVINNQDDFGSGGEGPGGGGGSGGGGGKPSKDPPAGGSPTPAGTQVDYNIVGFAAFRLTGYRFPGVTEGTGVACPASSSCIRGYFVEDSLSAGGAGGGGSSFGLKFVGMTE